jgi:predicted N-acetyltransferase YhbS
VIRIEAEAPAEAGARENLLDLAFGLRRSAKTSQRLRDDRLPAEGLAFSARTEGGRVIGTVRLWHISAGAKRPALLLGPLAVHPSFRRKGIGRRWCARRSRTKALGHAAVLLVGDESFYRRFGFCRALTEQLRLPGPFDRERFLGLELVSGALAGARGIVTATGAPAPATAPALPTAAPRRLTARARHVS